MNVGSAAADSLWVWCDLRVGDIEVDDTSVIDVDAEEPKAELNLLGVADMAESFTVKVRRGDLGFYDVAWRDLKILAVGVGCSR